MLDFFSFIITMFLFVGAVFSAVVPSAASSAVIFSSVVPTFVPHSDAFCASRGNGTAPEPSSNSLSGFMEDTKYNSLALSAPIPTGYALAMSNADCAFSSTRYMLYVQLDSYSPETCAELCNTHKGCDSFNIYIQRDPSVIPGPACPNPAPIAVTKCALYSEPEQVSSCTNFGQHIGPVDADGEAFKVAMRGSNAYNKVSSVKEVFVTITKTTTMSAGCQLDRREKTIFEEATSAKYDSTTTVRIPKATSEYVDPKTVDTPAGTVTVTSYNDYYIDTTTITSGGLGSATTVTVTASGTHTVTIPGPIVTITSQSPDTTITILAPQEIEYSLVASTPTVTLPDTVTITLTAFVVTITPTGADNTFTIYDKRDVAAAQFKGKEEGEGRWNAWTKEWMPAPHCCDSTTTVTRIGTPRPHHVLPSYIPRGITQDPDVFAVPTPITLTLPVPDAAATATDVVSPVGNAPAPMKTITLDDSYTYTGPTDVPMKTITLRA